MEEERQALFAKDEHGSDLFKYLAEMSHIKLIGKFKSIGCTELLSLFKFFHEFFNTITVLSFLMVTNGRGGVVDTFTSAMWCGKHTYLTKVRDFYHNGFIINRHRLFPWLPIYPHECMVSCTIMELETDSICLHNRTIEHKTQGENFSRNWICLNKRMNPMSL